MASSPPAACSPSLQDSLDRLSRIQGRISNALRDNAVLVLHRSQWQCLESSYSEVLLALSRLLQHDEFCAKLRNSLHVLYQTMEEAERCLQDCTATLSTCSHSWLMEKALKLGVSTDMVNVHLHDFLWSFSAVLNEATPQIDRSDLVELTRKLSEIWTCENEKADVLETCNFLNTLKAISEKEETLCLANFIALKLCHAQDLESVQPPTSLPDYLWINKGSLNYRQLPIGQGAHGIVRVAKWLDGYFAVKDFLYVEDNIPFGEEEAAIQVRFRHPNVISLVCCLKNLPSESCSLVTELMQQDLGALMTEKINAGSNPPFSLGVAVDLMLQVAKGVEYLHSLHTLHRDLKSANILVSIPRVRCDAIVDHKVGSCIHLKVADFGTSKAAHAGSKYTAGRFGSTQWRAPEINCKDEVGDAGYTEKADVYSFALVCYEILTGKFPFEGARVSQRVRDGERPMLPPYCPLALSSYIQTCWDAEPSRRPPFSQICRMFRYIKACQNQAPKNLLLHPLTLDLCARIDDLFLTLVKPVETRIYPVLVSIPLEMYCCGIVLKERTEVKCWGMLVKEPNSVYEEFRKGTAKVQKQCKGDSCSKLNSGALYVSSLLKCLCCLPQSGRVQTATCEFQTASFGPPVTSDSLPENLAYVYTYMMGSVCSPDDLESVYNYEELQLATGNFSTVVVGEAGLGTVSHHGRLKNGREITVKVIRYYQRSQNLGSFGQQLRRARHLRHPSIVRLIGWCQDDEDELLLVYDFMPNGDLTSHIFKEQGTHLTWRCRYTIIRQLASALNYLHCDENIVHGDVRPANVLLDSEGNARLGYCGLARLLQKDDNTAGTIGYMAPEMGLDSAVSAASDVYAFGITILEIATGRRSRITALIAKGEAESLREWVWSLYEAGHLREAADSSLGGEFAEAEMEQVLRLGLSCSNTLPSKRPVIEAVDNILSSSGASEPSLEIY